MRCPRRNEVGSIGEDHWREDNTCSYCGSIHPSTVFLAISKRYKITPTDKTYKIYVEIDDPLVGKPRIVGSTSEKTPPSEDWISIVYVPDSLKMGIYSERTTYVLLDTHSKTTQDKFYFQHMSVDEKIKFIDIYNRGEINFEIPGDFYVLPYFMVRKI